MDGTNSVSACHICKGWTNLTDVKMIGGVRLDSWLKLSLRLGRPFFAHEETVPHRTVDPEGNS